MNGREEGVWEISWPSGETLDLTYKKGITEGSSVRHLSNGNREKGRYAKISDKGSGHLLTRGESS